MASSQIIIIAIIANVIVGYLGMSTWYNFGHQFFAKGFSAVKEAGFINCLWLFFLYLKRTLFYFTYDLIGMYMKNKLS